MLRKEWKKLQRAKRKRRELAVTVAIETIEKPTMAAVAYMTGFAERDVRAIVQRLRLDGVEVCGDSSGYWIAKKADDLTHTINIFKARIRTTAEVLFALENRKKAMRIFESNIDYSMYTNAGYVSILDFSPTTDEEQKTVKTLRKDVKHAPQD